MTRTHALLGSLNRGIVTDEGCGIVTTVWLAGDQDASTKFSLTAALSRVTKRDGSDVLVDLSGVTFMDASTVRALMEAHRNLQSRMRVLQIRAPSPSALRVLQLCGLTWLVQVVQEPAQHPAGPAASLGTWVDVPTQAMPQSVDATPVDAAPSAPDRAVSLEVHRGRS